MDIETENLNTISINLVNKNDHSFLLNNEKHMMNFKSSNKIDNHFYFRSDLVNDNFLVIKNLDLKNASHIKIFAYPYYSSHNFWGPGNGGFWLAIITFSVGLTICFIAYSIYRRHLTSHKNSQYYLISTQSAGSVTSSTKTNANNLSLKNEFRILPK